jgi:hypothetical protein
VPPSTVVAEQEPFFITTCFCPRIALSNAWIMSFENTPDHPRPPAKFRDKAELTELSRTLIRPQSDHRIHSACGPCGKVCSQ